MLGIYESESRKDVYTNGTRLSNANRCNLSTEWSRLIGEAGRWCESYASDILYAADCVRGYLESLASGETVESREYWFGFREAGVDSKTVIDAYPADTYASHLYRAVWVWSFAVKGDFLKTKLKKMLII